MANCERVDCELNGYSTGTGARCVVDFSPLGTKRKSLICIKEMGITVEDLRDVCRHHIGDVECPLGSCLAHFAEGPITHCVFKEFADLPKDPDFGIQPDSKFLKAVVNNKL